MPEFSRGDHYYLDYDPPLAIYGTAPGQIELLGVRTRYTDIPWGESSPPLKVTGDFARRRDVGAAGISCQRTAGRRLVPCSFHLVDWSGLTVAQIDTMPGGGLRPTSGWPHNGVLLEDYLLTIPRTAYTPNRAHLQVGFYNHHTGERLSLEEGSSSYSFGVITIPIFRRRRGPSHSHPRTVCRQYRSGCLPLQQPPAGSRQGDDRHLVLDDFWPCGRIVYHLRPSAYQQVRDVRRPRP